MTAFQEIRDALTFYDANQPIARLKLLKNAPDYIRILLIIIDDRDFDNNALATKNTKIISELVERATKAEQERDVLQNRVNGLISDWANADTALEKSGIQMADQEGRKSIEEGIDVLAKERDALRAEVERLNKMIVQSTYKTEADLNREIASAIQRMAADRLKALFDSSGVDPLLNKPGATNL